MSENAERSSGSGDSDTKLGEIWITNRKRLVLFALVLLSSLSLPYFRKFNELWPDVHPVWPALLAGVIVSIMIYLPAKLVDDKFGFSHAVLMGLLVSEFTVYGAPLGFPTPVVISFFLFMFYIGESEAEALWPANAPH